MTDTSSTKPEGRVRRWAVLLVGLDQRLWNWVHEKAPIAVRVWFEWLNWVLLISVLEVIAKKYKSSEAAGAAWISYALVLYYFHGLYWRSEKPKIDPVTGVARRSYVGWIVAFLGALGVLLFVRRLVDTVTDRTAAHRTPNSGVQPALTRALLLSE